MERKPVRCNTISNAVLEHSRHLGKHVSFTDDGEMLIRSSSSLGNQSNDSLTTSEEEDDDYDDDHDHESRGRHSGEGGNDNVEEDDVFRHSSEFHRHNRRKTAEAKMAALTKFKSHPHAHSATKMAQTHSLEGAYLSQQNSQFNLPEFNKRPLTDTPIVSGFTSPDNRYHSESENEDRHEAEHEGARKNISHLSLADLNAVLEAVSGLRSDSISPGTLTAGPAAAADVPSALSSAKLPLSVSSGSSGTSEKLLPADRFPAPAQAPAPAPPEPKPPQSAAQSAGIKPHFALNKRKPSPDSKILQQIKQDLLQDVPPELQQQFEKTPSLEKLKSMLLLKPFYKSKKAYTLNIPGQTSSKTSPDGHIASVDVGSKLVIVMVGLPARGKSYITNKLTRYLNWLQHDCRVFNVGNTRRMDKEHMFGPATTPLPDTSTPLPSNGRSPLIPPASLLLEQRKSNSHCADFFNPSNKASNELREKWAMLTLDNLLSWVIDGPGSVGILDATNSTKKRRLKVLRKVQERSNGELKVLFLESICSDPAILNTNIHLKLSGPDYKDMDPELALKDFVGRLKNYEKAYEAIDESEERIEGFQYVKMIDVGKKVVSFNIQGFLASQTVYFLLNFNLCERQIWLTRHGESVDNLSGRIGGDAELTKRGQHFAKTLSRFLNYQRKEFRRKQLENFSNRLELRFNELAASKSSERSSSDLSPEDDGPEHTMVGQIPTEPSFCVWTSMLLRAVETGEYFNDQHYHVKAMRMLNELGGGKFDGMTYDEIQTKYPKEFDSRIKNKLTYRYPGVGGESYLDVLVRLRPVINEIERTTDHLLIVSHRVVLRVLLAYFLNLDKSTIVDLDVPLHTLYCLELKPYGTEYAMYEYDEHADWFKKVEPDHQKNVREVGVNYKERKYSVIPTAPPSGNPPRTSVSRRDRLSNFSVRKSIMGDEDVNLLSTRKLADLNKMRMP